MPNCPVGITSVVSDGGYPLSHLAESLYSVTRYNSQYTQICCGYFVSMITQDSFMSRRLSYIAITGLTLLIVLVGCADPALSTETTESAVVEPAPQNGADADAPVDVPVDVPTVTQVPADDGGDSPESVDAPVDVPIDAAPVSIEATPTLGPDDWQTMPTVPTISQAMLEVYERGQAIGNDPHAFSVVGDCQNVSEYFLADFAQDGEYRLSEEHADLQKTIDYYYDSFARDRTAVRGGFNVASVISPLWSDPELCEAGESPLACEYRINNPSIALISMETWWYDRPATTYEGYLRQIVEYSLEEGVIPILATKADNLEEDYGINKAIVRVAYEYDVPLWNFWAAVQPLRGGGLEIDAFHLTYARPFFDEPDNMENGWPVRNLTALQSLDAVRRAVTEEGD